MFIDNEVKQTTHVYLFAVSLGFGDHIDTVTDHTAVTATERNADAAAGLNLIAERIGDSVVELLCESARQYHPGHTHALRSVLLPRGGLGIEKMGLVFGHRSLGSYPALRLSAKLEMV